MHNILTYMQVTFHEDYEVPLVTELGASVSPGSHASFSLHKSEVSAIAGQLLVWI